jgi:hypothetical protein|tara:strand:- start:62 stop:928 length:867 start_codon:yes stop_codon:yes gene_type:complete
MKALWLVSFRPIGKSKINDFFQNVFVESIKSLDFDVTFSLTQFEEPNVKEFIEKKEIKNFYLNIPKSELPEGKKYSNKLMLENALNQFIDKDDFQYLIYSTADVIIPNNLFKVLSKIKLDKFCALIYPNTHVTDGKIKSNFWPHYGIDLIIFKISKNDAKKFQLMIKNYNQYDWGINENFYIAASEALNLKIFNLFKFSNVLKFDNDFGAFTEDRSWQVKSWKENQGYFLRFLKDNKLSQFYAYGSYYYLLYKIFNIKDLNFNLLFSYLIFYPYNLIKKVIRKIKISR